MALPKVKNIKLYAQIYCYREDYILSRLGSGYTNMQNKGKWFGFTIDAGVASLFSAQLNPFNPPADYLTIDLLSQPTVQSPLNIDILYDSIMQEIINNEAVVDLIGTKRFGTSAPLEEEISDVWYSFDDGLTAYIMPRVTDNAKVPLRIRFFYVITYDSSDGQEVIIGMPAGANQVYETVLNASEPYLFTPTEYTRIYADNELMVFNFAGTVVSKNTPAVNGVYNYDLPQGDSSCWIILKESVLGCKNIQDMDTNSGVSTVFLKNGTQANDIVEVLPEEYGEVPQAVLAQAHNSWVFKDVGQNVKGLIGDNVYDIMCSFIRARLYKHTPRILSEGQYMTRNISTYHLMSCFQCLT